MSYYDPAVFPHGNPSPDLGDLFFPGSYHGACHVCRWPAAVRHKSAGLLWCPECLKRQERAEAEAVLRALDA